MEGAARLGRQKCDIAINWAGGLHHAKKGEASGFCYVNGKGTFALLQYANFSPQILFWEYWSFCDFINEFSTLILMFTMVMALRKPSLPRIVS